MNCCFRGICLSLCLLFSFITASFGNEGDIKDEDIETHLSVYAIPLAMARGGFAWDNDLRYIMRQKAYIAGVELHILGIDANCGKNLTPDFWLSRATGAGYIAHKMIGGENENSIATTINIIASKLYIICSMHVYDTKKFLGLVLKSDFPKEIKDDAIQLLELTYDSMELMEYKEIYELVMKKENRDKLVRIMMHAMHTWAKDYVAGLVVPILAKAPGVSGKYEFLDTNSHIDEDNLAWVVERDLNIAPVFEEFKKWAASWLSDKYQICVNTTILTQREFVEGKYIPLGAHLSLLKHLAIQLAYGEGKLVYYDSNSRVRGLSKDAGDIEAKSDSAALYMKRLVHNYAIGFNNEGISKVLMIVSAQWDRKSDQWNGIDYDWYNHNCQDYINSFGGVIDEYVRHGYKIYLKHK